MWLFFSALFSCHVIDSLFTSAVAKSESHKRESLGEVLGKPAQKYRARWKPAILSLPYCSHIPQLYKKSKSELSLPSVASLPNPHTTFSNDTEICCLDYVWNPNLNKGSRTGMTSPQALILLSLTQVLMCWLQSSYSWFTLVQVRGELSP